MAVAQGLRIILFLIALLCVDLLCKIYLSNTSSEFMQALLVIACVADAMQR